MSQTALSSNAMLPSSFDVPGVDIRKGLLVITGQCDPASASSYAGMAQAIDMRLQGVVSLDDAADRLDMQAGCDLIMLVCDQADAQLERLIIRLDTLAGMGETELIVVANLASLDLIFAAGQDGRTQLLCNPDPIDIAAALVKARNARNIVPTLHDISRESENMRLQRLSDEVGRLARTLETLTGGSLLQTQHGALPSFDTGPRVSDRPSDYIGMPALAPMGGRADKKETAVTAAQVRDLLRARRLRNDFFPDDLFADPAWDMLLDLYAARLDAERVSVSSLCIASAVPPTTALRWIRTLMDKALVLRQADPQDGRRIFIALTDAAADALQRWFLACNR